MATLDELERTFRANPALADLLAALDRSAAAVAATGLTVDDLLADLPAIRAQVARRTATRSWTSCTTSARRCARPARLSCRTTTRAAGARSIPSSSDSIPYLSRPQRYLVDQYI